MRVLAGDKSGRNKAGRTSWPGVASKKIHLMSDVRKQRVKEQAEAYLKQLRTIPRPEALSIMEQLLDELFMLRDVHCAERDYYRGDSCNPGQQS